MSREAKILIFSIILVFSAYLKYSDSDIFDSSKSSYKAENKSTPKRSNSKTTPKSSNSKYKTNSDGLPIFENTDAYKDLPNLLREADETIREADKYFGNSDSSEFDLDSPDYTAVPKSGYSPYDRYFGKGVYHSTDNSVVVKASNNTHVVFILIDTYTGKRIRNEFIRKGETFTMTKVPYGTYDYMYFTGRNWSKDVMINNGKIKGGFKDYQNFQKNKTGRDQMNFKTGYYGSYRIELVSQIGGNLKTQSTSEQDFFN